LAAEAVLGHRPASTTQPMKRNASMPRRLSLHRIMVCSFGLQVSNGCERSLCKQWTNGERGVGRLWNQELARS